MSTGTPRNPEVELYLQILRMLERLDANELAELIRVTVARGSVGDSSDELNGKSFRRMDSKQSLAVAVSFIVSFLEAPLMIQSAEKTLETNSIEWRTDNSAETAIEFEDALEPLPIAALRASLQELIQLIDELGLTVPESA